MKPAARRTEITAAAVLFDLDGVLVDSTPAVERHWRAFAGRHGLDPDETVAAGHGRRSADVIAELAGRLAPGSDPQAENAAFEQQEAGDTAGSTAIAGAAAALDAVGEAYRAIVTSGSRQVATARLRAVGLPAAAVLVSADDVSRGKPDPEGYLAAAGLLGVPIAVCVVIEDSPAGIAAGRAAGATVLAVLSSHDRDEVRAADHVVTDLTAVEFGAAGGLVRLRITPAVD